MFSVLNIRIYQLQQLIIIACYKPKKFVCDYKARMCLFFSRKRLRQFFQSLLKYLVACVVTFSYYKKRILPYVRAEREFYIKNECRIS